MSNRQSRDFSEEVKILRELLTHLLPARSILSVHLWRASALRDSYRHRVPCVLAACRMKALCVCMRVEQC